MRVVTDIVARGLVAPRLERVLDFDPDALAQRIHALFGNLRKLFRVVGHDGTVSLQTGQRLK